MSRNKSKWVDVNRSTFDCLRGGNFVRRNYGCYELPIEPGNFLLQSGLWSISSWISYESLWSESSSWWVPRSTKDVYLAYAKRSVASANGRSSTAVLWSRRSRIEGIEQMESNRRSRSDGIEQKESSRRELPAEWDIRRCLNIWSSLPKLLLDLTGSSTDRVAFQYQLRCHKLCNFITLKLLSESCNQGQRFFSLFLITRDRHWLPQIFSVTADGPSVPTIWLITLMSQMLNSI